MHFTIPYSDLSHSHCGLLTEWEQSPPTRTTHGSFRSDATPARRRRLPSERGYPSGRLHDEVQGSFDGKEEGEPAVHVFRVGLRLDRHDDMFGQLPVSTRYGTHDSGEESREPVHDAFLLHRNGDRLHATPLPPSTFDRRKSPLESSGYWKEKSGAAPASSFASLA